MKKYFDNINSFMELKKEYKRLCFKLHPDLGGNKEEFQNMQNEYESIFDYWKNKNNETEEKKYHTSEGVKDYKDIVEQLLKLGLDFDVVNNWIWIVANKDTYPVRDKISQLGFIYSKAKRKFWKDLSGAVTERTKGYKSKKKYSDITSKYGCKSFVGKKVEILKLQ